MNIELISSIKKLYYTNYIEVRPEVIYLDIGPVPMNHVKYSDGNGGYSQISHIKTLFTEIKRK